MQGSVTNQQGVEYEDLNALANLKICSLPYEEAQPPSLINTPAPDSHEYDYITTSTSRAVVSSHGDESKEFDYRDCDAYNVTSNMIESND